MPSHQRARKSADAVSGAICHEQSPGGNQSAYFKDRIIQIVIGEKMHCPQYRSFASEKEAYAGKPVS
jgi:hypothetical protein